MRVQSSYSNLITHISAKSIIPDTFLTGDKQRIKHQICTWHFNHISALIITLFLLTVQPMLFRIFTGFLSAFLTVWRLQANWQSRLVQNISYSTLFTIFFQSAQVGVLFAKRCQTLSQPGIVGVNLRSVLSLIKENNSFLLILR